MDIASTLVGNSDQLDNVDLMAGPRDFTITGVTAGNGEQPLNIALAEFPRPWRPGLTMRRVLAGIWGTDASAYVGRKVRLYRDESVTFGKDATGGTRISHASDIDKAVTLTLPTSRGKFGKFIVQPLVESKAAKQPTTDPGEDAVADCTDTSLLREWWKTSGKERQAQIEARVAELAATTEPDADANSQWDALPIAGDA